MAATLDLLRRLHDAGVEFIIIGGVAAIAHGSAVVTEDLDLCASLTRENAARIITALQGLRPRWWFRQDLPIVTPDSPNLSGLKNMYLRTDAGRLDVLGELPGVCSYDELKGRTEEMNFGGVLYRVVNLDTLIAAKRVANREKDQLAIRQLEAIRKMRMEQPGLFDPPPGGS